MLSQFVGDAAPGEAAVIARDIQVLSGDNSSTKTQVAKQLAAFNISSLRVVKVKDYYTVLSPYNQAGESRFWSRGCTFEVDNTSGITSSIEQDKPLDADGESLLSKLGEYANQHYTTPVYDVFPHEQGHALVIVGEKLSPRNFINGSWAAQYTTTGSGVAGSIKIDVHYFEDGNVRLKASHKVNSSSGDVIEAIAQAEDKFQQDLTAELAQLNERQFKALRRQLPVTRSQMVWSKASAGYKIGAELNNRE